jgi:hypothetical protein
MKIHPYNHVGGFSIKAQAKMDTLDLYNKNFDIVAEVPWSAILVMSGVVAAISIAGQYIFRKI